MTLLVKDLLTNKVLGEVNLPGSTTMKELREMTYHAGAQIEFVCKPIIRMEKGETK